MIGNTIGKSGAARWTKILLASTILGSGGAGVASAIALSVAVSLGGVSQAFSAPAPDSKDLLLDGAGESDTWSTDHTLLNDLIIGLYTQGAVLTIDSGAKVTVGDNVIIAGVRDSEGTVVVTGVGSELNVQRGGSGDETLNVGGGGDGLAAIPNTGGNGTLRIENGGKADAKLTYVGYGQYARGTLVVTGAGSSLTTDQLRLGTGLDATGSSTVTIADGGSIATNSVETFGKGSTDHLTTNVLVTGEGSKWVNAGHFKLGGDMAVENGGSFTTSTAEIGNSIVHENTFYLTGDKSSFNVTDTLTIKDGNLSVANGAKLNVANGIKLTGENGYLTIGGKIDMSDVFDEPKPLAAEAAGSINKEAVITFGSTKSEGHLSFNHTGTGSTAYTLENALVGNGIITALAGETILSGDLTKFYSTAGRLGGGVVVDGDGAKLVLKGDLGTAASDPALLSPTRTSFRVNNGTLVLGGATGQLVANNSYYSSVFDVNAKGRLEGWGTIGSTDVNGGVIAPGTSDNRIGTITVKGDLTFYANSIYNVDIAGNGTSDKIVVESVNQNGIADIKNNVNVNVTALEAATNYQTGQTYTILTAAGGITGQFAQAVSQSAFLDVSLDQQANQVDLKIKVKQDPGGQNPGGQNPGGQNPGGQNPGGQNPGGQNPGGQNPGGQPSRPGPNVSGPFDDVTETHNQYETAVALNSLPQDGGAGHALYNALLPLNAADGRAAFEQLSGEVHASGATALINSSQYVRNAANDRVRAAFGEVAAAAMPVMAYGPDGKDIEAATTAKTAAWGQVFGAWSSIDGDGNASRMKQSTGGFVTGIDTELAEAWRVGVLAGYSRTSFDAKDRSSSGDSDNYHLGLYGGTRWGALALRTGLSYTWSNIETGRTVSFRGFNDGLSADYDAGAFQAFGELGYRLDAAGAAFEPFVNLAHVSLHTDGFTEKGGAAALSAEAQTTNTTFSTLGLRASTDFMLGSVAASANGTVGWKHAFGDTTPFTTVGFAGSSLFTVAGVPIAKNTFVLQTGLDMKVTDNATIGISYNGEFGSGSSTNGVDARLGIRF